MIPTRFTGHVRLASRHRPWPYEAIGQMHRWQEQAYSSLALALALAYSASHVECHDHGERRHYQIQPRCEGAGHDSIRSLSGYDWRLGDPITGFPDKSRHRHFRQRIQAYITYFYPCGRIVRTGNCVPGLNLKPVKRGGDACGGRDCHLPLLLVEGLPAGDTDIQAGGACRFLARTLRLDAVLGDGLAPTSRVRLILINIRVAS
jgi:hypothetical protein